MIFDYWQIVPLTGIGLTIPLWVWLFFTRTKRVNDKNRLQEEKEHYSG